MLILPIHEHGRSLHFNEHFIINEQLNLWKDLKTKRRLFSVAPWPSLSTKVLFPSCPCNIMGSFFQWVNWSCPFISPMSGAQMSCITNIWSRSGESEFWPHQDPGDQTPTLHKHISRSFRANKSTKFMYSQPSRPKQKFLTKYKQALKIAHRMDSLLQQYNLPPCPGLSILEHFLRT
jgi:hypothetical protein